MIKVSLVLTALILALLFFEKYLVGHWDGIAPIELVLRIDCTGTALVGAEIKVDESVPILSNRRNETTDKNGAVHFETVGRSFGRHFFLFSTGSWGINQDIIVTIDKNSTHAFKLRASGHYPFSIRETITRQTVEYDLDICA